MYKPDDLVGKRYWNTNGDTGGKPINTLAWGEGLFAQYGYYPFDHHHLYNVFPATGWLWRTDREMERTKVFYVDLEIFDYTSWTWTGYYQDHSVRGAYNGATGLQPPVEGMRWHHTERKF